MHHHMDAVEAHDDGRNSEQQPDLQYKRVEGIPFVLKSLEQDNRSRKHQQEGIQQVDQAF